MIDPVANLSIRADSSEAHLASTWVGDVGSARGIPADPLLRLELCVTEALANVIAHSGAAASGSPIRLRLDARCSASGGAASVTVSDAGKAFNPLEAPPKVQPRTLAEADAGGHGLLLMARFADALDYSHREGQNHLTIHVRWDEDKPQVSPEA